MNVFLYRVFIQLYYLGAKIASFWNPKAALWIDGRIDTWEKIKIKDIKGCIWFHVSSLGEFEQARPLIEQIKKKNPLEKIALSFYSPSGYEIRKNFPLVDLVFYLPLDTKSNAEKLISVLQPQKVIWVKYDFWYFMLRELYLKKIPTVLICANFRNDQLFFKWYGGFYRDILLFFNRIYVQNTSSQLILSSINVLSHIAYDTRFDRVEAGRIQFQNNDFVELFKGDNPLIVFGSTWKEDDLIIADAIEQLFDDFPKLKVIIAPHDINFQRILETKEMYNQSILYSNRGQWMDEKILIIDNIGMLSNLYAYATIAYVGGAFTKSVHNVLEPSVFAIPVVFGPKYYKSQEAIDLISLGGTYAIHSSKELNERLSSLILDLNICRVFGNLNRKYIEERLGGTDIIINYVESI